jgi:N-methylhydantoinase A
MSSLRVAVDVGGTFTDVCAFEEATGLIEVAKVPSTSDPIDGVLNGLRQANIEPREIGLFSHGTTVATNALLTRTLPRAAMVTTSGFRDVIEIRRGTKQDVWDTYRDAAPPYIRRRDRLVVSERVDYAGRVIQALDHEEAAKVAETLAQRDVDAVAICFINAYANPANEVAMRRILEEALPGVVISTSSDVLPEIFEHERFSTTVVNAILGPVVGSYSRRLGQRLGERGYEGDVLLLHSGGGVLTSTAAERFAARLAGSGIAAGAIAVQHIATTCGFENAIGLDMGGTSTDVSVVRDGQLRTRKDWYIEYGYPIGFPSIDVLTVGAGGGSLAWIDEGGSLRSGPASAGAHPGPACYGYGNTQPTTTDAHAVLGHLGEELLGGEMSLDRSAAEAAIAAQIAAPLGLSTLEAANAILQVANANMADAVRLMSVQRGHDPRDFALLAFGGAGPLHGVDLARELSIPTVLVPHHPGVTSALGCLLVDVRHDLAAMHLARVDDVSVDELEERFAELEREATMRLEAEGFEPGATSLDRTLDMRYLGQWRSLGVSVRRPIDSLEAAVERFHQLHQAEHDYRRSDTPVEVYRLNVCAVAPTAKAHLAPLEPGNTRPVPRTSRHVVFDSSEAGLETPVYARSELGVGSELEGPAVIEELDSTTMLPPGSSARIDEWLNIRIRVDA